MSVKLEVEPLRSLSEFDQLWEGTDSMPEGILIFPPQGDLRAGVGKHEYENSPAFRDFIDRSDQIIGGDTPFSKKMFEDPDNDLSDPPNAQLALTVACLALLEMGKEQQKIKSRPEKIISLSGSEVAAAYAAGEIPTLEATFKAAVVRGQLTKMASEGHDVLMTTLIAAKAESAILENALGLIELNNNEEKRIGGTGVVSVSGINSPLSIGLTGDRHMVEALKVGLSDITRRSNDMDMIKIGSHSKLMNKISERYGNYMRNTVRDIRIPVNMNGVDVATKEEAVARFERGLVEPIDFVSAVESITRNGQTPTIYELSTKQTDSEKGKTSAWGRFANDTLGPSGLTLNVVVI